MDKVDINLLPTEVSVEQKKQAKFSRIQAISIGVLLLLILVASLSVALRIFQAQQLAKLGKDAKTLEEKVNTFKDKEAILVLLKNRVTAIAQLVSSGKNPNIMFNLITDKIPGSATITAISVDKVGNVILSLVVPNSSSMEETLAALTSADSFEKITKIDIESLASGTDGAYRINLKIHTKTGGKS